MNKKQPTDKKQPEKEFRVSSKHFVANTLPRVDACKAESNCKSDGDVLEFLLGFWEKNKGIKIPEFSQNKPTGYDLTEQELVAFATQNLPFEQLIKKGVLAESKRIYSESKNDDPARGTRSESYRRIDKVVRNQMAINEKGIFFEQRFISSAWIQLATKESFGTACNFWAIQEYMNIHESELKQHHEKCKIEVNHNRKVKHAIKEQAKPQPVVDDD